MILRKPFPLISLAAFACLLLLFFPSSILPVNAGFAFLPNQSDCKLNCLNGGVCSYDTDDTSQHKCICFIGLFEGEQCERQVTAESTPAANEELDNGQEEHEVEQVDSEEEEEEVQVQATVGPQEEQLIEPSEDGTDYETELLVGEPHHNKEEQGAEIVIEPAVVNSLQLNSGGSFSSEEMGEASTTTAKPGHHSIHLADNSHFADVPANPHIKHYENGRTRSSTQPADPNDHVMSAWEARPKQPRKRPEPDNNSDNDNVRPTERQRKKKRPNKKNREETEGDLVMAERRIYVDDEEDGGWMMTKRKGSPSSGSKSSAMGIILLTATCTLFYNIFMVFII